MIGWPFGDLIPMKYGVILADPPWRYTLRSDNGRAKSPCAHYATMDAEAIRALPVGQLAAPDCLLFLWSTWPHLPLAMECLHGWGFSYVTGGAWVKRTPTGKATFGTGYVLRSSTEPFIVGKIGRPTTSSRSCRNLIEADELPDLIDGLRREHSRKPPQMRDLIDELMPDAWGCELFAREAWSGRDVWGAEADKFEVAQ